jgi:hypothetical protein
VITPDVGLSTNAGFVVDSTYVIVGEPVKPVVSSVDAKVAEFAGDTVALIGVTLSVPAAPARTVNDPVSNAVERMTAPNNFSGPYFPKWVKWFITVSSFFFLVTAPSVMERHAKI